ncbi:MAG: YdcH family protein [Acidobacteriota bacterium]
MKEEEIKKVLLSENEEFKKLYDSHQKYEKELQELSSKKFLTDDERLEIKRIKKEKLILKDKMQLIMEQYQTSLKK